MPDGPDTQDPSPQAPVQAPSRSEPTRERPKPPRTLEREPEPPPEGALDRLIRRIAV